MAQFFRDALDFTIGLMPYGTLGFEQTFVRVEVLQGKTGIEVFTILTNKGDEVLHNVIERFIASRQRGTMGHMIESKDLVHLGMPFQPATLGFEAKDAALLHHKEEHDQCLM